MGKLHPKAGKRYLYQKIHYKWAMAISDLVKACVTVGSLVLAAKRLSLTWF